MSTHSKMNELMKKNPDWKKNIQKRYIKFLTSYEESGYDLETTAKAHHYSLSDMSSIFSRIEKELQQFMWRNMFPELDTPRRKELSHIIQWSETHLEQVNQVLPDTLKQKILLLIEFKSTSKVAEVLQTKESQLLYSIFGRSNPRKPFEKGVYGYLPLKKPS